MQATHAAKADAMMEQATQALVKGDYFVAERMAASALRRAHAAGDFDRMARILLPLQEARRLKRQQAMSAGPAMVIDSELPVGRKLVAGCYLVMPPRVGVDGRMLREAADDRKTPVIVVVREPQSRDGLWPIVSVGPVTVRTKVAPPVAPVAKPSKKTKGKTSVKSEVEVATAVPSAPEVILPSAQWFMETCEALGDAAILEVPATLPAANRVDALLDRLEAIPDHEKLHQRLAEACREALREPDRKRRKPVDEFGDEDEAFSDLDDEDDEEV